MRENARRHPILGPVLVVLTLTATGLGLLVWAAVVQAHGASVSPWLTALWVSLLPAVAIAGSTHLVFTTYLARPPRFALILVVAYAVLVLVCGLALSVAAASYDDPTVLGLRP